MTQLKHIPRAWCTKVAMAFILPWVLVIGSANVLEVLLPSIVRTDHWRHFCSIVFLAGGIWAAVLMWQLPSSRIARAVVSMLVLAGGLWFAFAIQMRSNCGDESEYMGARPQDQSSCS
jgi:hypothetical protein